MDTGEDFQDIAVELNRTVSTDISPNWTRLVFDLAPEPPEGWLNLLQAFLREARRAAISDPDVTATVVSITARRESEEQGEAIRLIRAFVDHTNKTYRDQIPSIE